VLKGGTQIVWLQLRDSCFAKQSYRKAEQGFPTRSTIALRAKIGRDDAHGRYF
jgi:hypothetical protein